MLAPACALNSALRGKSHVGKDLPFSCFKPAVQQHCRGHSRCRQQFECSKGFGFKGFGGGSTKHSTTESGQKLANDSTPVWKKQKKACPCGSGAAYKECCERYHEGASEPTCEALMRARFSAYAKGKAQYVIDTTHPDNKAWEGSKAPDGTVASTFEQDVRATCKKVEFVRLEVLRTEPGSSVEEGFVEFRSWFKVVGQRGYRDQAAALQSFQERSRFLKEDGRWLYVDGTPDFSVAGGN